MYLDGPACMEPHSGFNGNPYLAASVAATALASSGDTTQDSSGLDDCIAEDDIPVISVRRADTLFSKMVNVIGGEFLPDDRDRKYYADSYTCWPPPLFVLFVTICQVRIRRSPSVGIFARSYEGSCGFGNPERLTAFVPPKWERLAERGSSR